MPQSEFRQLLSSEFAPYTTLSGSQLDQLEAHYKILQHWNQRMNLTRIRRLQDVVGLHYCESLFLGTLLPPGNLTIADVGSGPGFPGIPLAVLRPECAVTLIESHQRKAVFLREASRNLPNVLVVSSRAEDVQLRFDWMVSRAVSPDELVGFKLAPKIALLIGQEDALQLGSSWRITASPWGKGRVAALKFHVEHYS